jgi:4-oxalocrotonate tautomerase
MSLYQMPIPYDTLEGNWEFRMPYVNIKITRESVTPEQKRQLTKGATDLLVKVLNKNPATTFVIIDEIEMDNWGIAGLAVEQYQKEAKIA